MRAPFARWLLAVQGWDELRVRDAVGYERLRDLRKLILGLEEASAQIQSTEILVLEPGTDSRRTSAATAFQRKAATASLALTPEGAASGLPRGRSRVGGQTRHKPAVETKKSRPRRLNQAAIASSGVLALRFPLW